MNNAHECPDDRGEDHPGDREVAELLWTHYDLVLSYIDSSMPDSLRRVADADDILQETYASAWRSLDSLSPQDSESFGAWLKTIAKRKLIDQIRVFEARKRGGGEVTKHIGNLDRRSMQVDALTGGDRSPSSEVASIEARALLNESLHKISERHQQVITLRYLDCRSLADVATQMRLSSDAAHMLLRRAIVSLRNAMGSRSQYF